MKEALRSKIFKCGLIAIPLIFYGIFWLLDGAVWCADSISYVTMYDSREPLYPTMLALFRTVCGYRESVPMEEQPYLFWVVGMQSLLAAASVTGLVSFLSERFRLNGLTALTVMVIPLGTSLLNRFAARRGSMYSNCILTEGITISIYLLFFRHELEYVLTGSRRHFVMAAVMALLGISARKQMYVLAALLIVGEMLRRIRERQSDGGNSGRGSAVKKWLVLLVTLVLMLVASGIFDRAYNYVLRGAFVRHTEDNRFVTTVAMYAADREFAEYVDPGIRDVFLEIYDECDAAGYLQNSAPGGWMDGVAHFAGNYDHIQLDVMEVVLERCVDDLEYAPLAEASLHSERMDVVRSAFNASLIPHETGRLTGIFASNFMSGLVLTVARMNRVLAAYSVIAYAGFIVLLAVLFRNGQRGRSKPDDGCAPESPDEGCVPGSPADGGLADLPDGNTGLMAQDAFLSGCLVLAGIVLNVGLVSAVIFCQTRYTIYNMPLFYVAGIVMMHAMRDKGTVHGDKGGRGRFLMAGH